MRAQGLLGGLQGRDRHCGLTLAAYAAGDAFGVPYEFLEERPAVDRLHMGSMEGWPPGGVSDDTLLSFLTLEALTPGDPASSRRKFLDALHREAPHLRGLGPTTKHALGLEVKESERHLIGRSNGALMRTSLCGLGFPAQSRHRDDTVIALARATHSAEEAVGAAVVGAALFSHAMDDSTHGESLLDLTREVAGAFQGTTLDLSEWAAGLAGWTPPARGISLEPLETLAAVLWVASASASALDAYIAACELGGDTDTVAALAGALVTANSTAPDELLEIPWIDDVAWSELEDLPRIVRQLSDVWSAQ